MPNEVNEKFEQAQSDDVATSVRSAFADEAISSMKGAAAAGAKAGADTAATKRSATQVGESSAEGAVAGAAAAVGIKATEAVASKTGKSAVGDGFNAGLSGGVSKVAEAAAQKGAEAGANSVSDAIGKAAAAGVAEGVAGGITKGIPVLKGIPAEKQGVINGDKSYPVDKEILKGLQGGLGDKIQKGIPVDGEGKESQKTFPYDNKHSGEPADKNSIEKGEHTSPFDGLSQGALDKLQKGSPSNKNLDEESNEIHKSFPNDKNSNEKQNILNEIRKGMKPEEANESRSFDGKGKAYAIPKGEGMSNERLKEFDRKFDSPKQGKNPDGPNDQKSYEKQFESKSQRGEANRTEPNSKSNGGGFKEGFNKALKDLPKLDLDLDRE